MTTKLTGKMIADMFIATHPDALTTEWGADALTTEWGALRVYAQESHIRTAQALNVKLGLLPSDRREYILSNDVEAHETSDIAGLLALVQQQGNDEPFRIAIIVNGKETGHAWYEINKDGELKTLTFYYRGEPLAPEEYGDAIGLYEVLYDELQKVQV